MRAVLAPGVTSEAIAAQRRTRSTPHRHHLAAESPGGSPPALLPVAPRRHEVARGAVIAYTRSPSTVGVPARAAVLIDPGRANLADQSSLPSVADRRDHVLRAVDVAHGETRGRSRPTRSRRRWPSPEAFHHRRSVAGPARSRPVSVDTPSRFGPRPAATPPERALGLVKPARAATAAASGRSRHEQLRDGIVLRRADGAGKIRGRRRSIS